MNDLPWSPEATQRLQKVIDDTIAAEQLSHRVIPIDYREGATEAEAGEYDEDAKCVPPNSIALVEAAENFVVKSRQMQELSTVEGLVSNAAVQLVRQHDKRVLQTTLSGAIKAGKTKWGGGTLKHHAVVTPAAAKQGSPTSDELVSAVAVARQQLNYRANLALVCGDGAWRLLHERNGAERLPIDVVKSSLSDGVSDGEVFPLRALQDAGGGGNRALLIAVSKHRIDQVVGVRPRLDAIGFDANGDRKFRVYEEYEVRFKYKKSAVLLEW